MSDNNHRSDDRLERVMVLSQYYDQLYARVVRPCPDAEIYNPRAEIIGWRVRGDKISWQATAESLHNHWVRIIYRAYNKRMRDSAIAEPVYLQLPPIDQEQEVLDVNFGPTTQRQMMEYTDADWVALEGRWKGLVFPQLCHNATSKRNHFQEFIGARIL